MNGITLQEQGDSKNYILIIRRYIISICMWSSQNKLKGIKKKFGTKYFMSSKYKTILNLYVLHSFEI